MTLRMRTLILEALDNAFQSEVAHTYSITSRELKDRGGSANAAKTLKTRIDNLFTYHTHIRGLIMNDDKLSDQ